VRTIPKLVATAVLCGAAVYAVVAALHPWALHIGGRSTPLLYWTGMGTLIARDGKSYPLYVFFYPGTSASRLHREGLRPDSGLKGTAELCKAPGTSQQLKLSGTMYGGYSSTEGSLMDFRLLEWKAFDPQVQRGYFDLAGHWHGGELTMDHPGEQGRTFLSGVHIEGATVTLHYATHGEFEAACRGIVNKAVQ
jgi:hypothetical protein